MPQHNRRVWYAARYIEKMITLKLKYKGDYSHEFGGDTPRIWRVFRVWDGNEILGTIEQEPEGYSFPFRAYSTDWIIGGNYIGQFKTRREATRALKEGPEVEKEAV